MLGRLVSKTRWLDDALSKQRNLSCETKTVNTSWSQGILNRVVILNTQHNVNQALLRLSGNVKAQTLHRFS
jgi:hypothetical protein